MSDIAPLKRQELINVIERKGAASRVPMLYDIWVHPNEFGDRKQAVLDLLDKYPCDVQLMCLRRAEQFDAPADDPTYRLSYYDNPYTESTGLDEMVVIRDWDQDLEKVLAEFPNAEYPGLFLNGIPESDGRYRLSHMWFLLFESHWRFRGMTAAMMDYYEYPDEVHQLFRALTDYWKRAIERAAKEGNADGIFVSDDLGTQANTFFSPDIFDEFYAPYYKEIIDTAHANNMHFWLHSCGNVKNFIPKLIELGLDVLHPIQKHTMEEQEINEKFGNDITFLAGFDVQHTIPWGTPEEVREEVRFLVDTYNKPTGGMLLTAGNGVNGDCTLPSLEALLDESSKAGS